MHRVRNLRAHGHLGNMDLFSTGGEPGRSLAGAVRKEATEAGRCQTSKHLDAMLRI